MNAVNRALAIHNRAQQLSAGVWVTYTDGELSIRCLAVRAQDGPNRIHGGEGEMEIDGDVIDWLIVAADLLEDGNRIRPRPGARIIPEDATAIFEVVDGPTGKCWQWSGTDRYRIHTDAIETIQTP